MRCQQGHSEADGGECGIKDEILVSNITTEQLEVPLPEIQMTRGVGQWQRVTNSCANTFSFRCPWNIQVEASAVASLYPGETHLDPDGSQVELQTPLWRAMPGSVPAGAPEPSVLGPNPVSVLDSAIQYLCSKDYRGPTLCPLLTSSTPHPIPRLTISLLPQAGQPALL